VTGLGEVGRNIGCVTRVVIDACEAKKVIAGLGVERVICIWLWRCWSLYKLLSTPKHLLASALLVRSMSRNSSIQCYRDGVSLL
jgi:hypothetical protein